MSTILAIDPGPKESGFVIYDSDTKVFPAFGILGNHSLMDHLDIEIIDYYFQPSAINFYVIEKIAGMGMAVGADIFETVYWTGIFARTIGLTLVSRIPRHRVKMCLCGRMQAKPTNIMTALVDRFDPHREFGKYGKGTKKKRGPFYDFRDHIWAAAALAVTFAEVNLT